MRSQGRVRRSDHAPPQRGPAGDLDARGGPGSQAAAGPRLFQGGDGRRATGRAGAGDADHRRTQRPSCVVFICFFGTAAKRRRGRRERRGRWEGFDAPGGRDRAEGAGSRGEGSAGSRVDQVADFGDRKRRPATTKGRRRRQGRHAPGEVCEPRGEGDSTQGRGGSRKRPPRATRTLRRPNRQAQAQGRRELKAQEGKQGTRRPEPKVPRGDRPARSVERKGPRRPDRRREPEGNPRTEDDPGLRTQAPA
mmetsp:Transcript_38768/g.124269  ORF Transcript_38768/g.124269 Transcript_38768/m.124269 type:complete len:250 (+) Transcript_38768:354-1103(+)